MKEEVKEEVVETHNEPEIKHKGVINVFLSSLCIQIDPKTELVQTNRYFTDKSLETKFTIPEYSAVGKLENKYIFTGGYVDVDGSLPIGGTNIVYEVFPKEDDKGKATQWKIEKFAHQLLKGRYGH